MKSNTVGLKTMKGGNLDSKVRWQFNYVIYDNV